MCALGDDICVRICVFGDEYVRLAMICVRICVFSDEYVRLGMISVSRYVCLATNMCVWQ